MSNELIVALVGVGGALLGAGVGALASYLTTRASLKQQTEQHRSSLEHQAELTAKALRQEAEQAARARADDLRRQSFAPAQTLAQTFGIAEREFRRLTRKGVDEAEVAAAPESVWTEDIKAEVSSLTILLSEEWARRRLFDVATRWENATNAFAYIGESPLTVLADLAAHGKTIASMHIHGADEPPEEPAVFQAVNDALDDAQQIWYEESDEAEKVLQAEGEEIIRELRAADAEAAELDAHERREQGEAALQHEADEEFDEILNREKPFSPEAWPRD